MSGKLPYIKVYDGKYRSASNQDLEKTPTGELSVSTGQIFLTAYPYVEGSLRTVIRHPLGEFLFMGTIEEAKKAIDDARRGSIDEDRRDARIRSVTG